MNSGAFTGAVSTKKGRFEVADGGTLFLDEVGEISRALQVKLLRVLDTRTFERVGDPTPRHVDIRLVAATNNNLEELVQQGKYREDLYHRLRVVTIHMPPLRERKEDIPMLVDAFIREFSDENGKHIEGITNAAMRFLMRYYWPGNVRQLKNCIESMVVMARHSGILDVDDLPEHILMADASYIAPKFPLYTPLRKERLSFPTPVSAMPASNEIPKILLPQLNVHVGMSMDEIEREAIKATIEYTGNNKAQTARILDIGKKTLYRKIEKYGLTTFKESDE